MAIDLETLQIQFVIRDNTGSKLKKLQKQLAGMESPEIDADTEKAEKKLKELKQSAQDVDAEVEVDADTKDAENKIKSVGKSAQNIGGGTVEIGGDKSEFDAVLKTVKGAAENIDAGSADIGGDKSGFENVTASVKGAADDIDAGSADIGGDKSGFDTAVASVKSSVGSLPDGSVEIYGEPNDAISDIETVQQKVGELPDSPTITPEVDINNAERGLQRLYSNMKAIGLIAGAKKVFEFGMTTANEAYAKQAVQNQLQNLGDSGAMEAINDYAAGMQESYGLNATNTAEIAKNFTAVYKELGKGIGLSADEAAQIGVSMTQNVIDFASALDKTPGEIADIFMSVLKGNVEVADSASIYGLTMDVINQRIDETLGITALTKKLETAQGDEAAALESQIETLKADRDANLKYYQAMAFYEKVMETASPEGLGFAGDWERTYTEFGNQQTVLGDQWKTLKETIGTFIVNPAAEATTALNGLLGSVNSFLLGLGESSFVNKLSDYFGTAEMTEEQKQKIIDGIVGPVKDINDEIGGPINDLNSAVSKHQQAYKGLAEILDFYYGTGEKVDSREYGHFSAKISGAYDEFKQSAKEALASGENTILSMFEAFAGPEDQWTAATTTAVNNINTYYDGLTAAINEKHAAFEKSMREALQDGIISREELSVMKQNAIETMQILMEGVSVSSGAKTQMYFDGRQADINALIRSGSFSAATLEGLYQGAVSATDEQRQQLSTYYESLRLSTYEAAEYNRQWYERDPEGFLAANQGQPPATAQEMLADAEKGYQSMLNEMDADLVDQMARFIFPSITSAFMEKIENEKITNDKLLKEIITPLAEFSGLADRIRGLKENGIELSDESNRFLELYDSTMSLIGGAEVWDTQRMRGKYMKGEIPFDFGGGTGKVALDENGEKIRDASGEPIGEAEWWYQQLLERVTLPSIDLFPNVGTHMPNTGALYTGVSTEDGLNSFAADMSSVAGEFSSAVASFPDNINVNVQIGGYELGSATITAIETVGRSTGQATV